MKTVDIGLVKNVLKTKENTKGKNHNSYVAGTVSFANPSDVAKVSSRSALGLRPPAGTGFGCARKLGLRMPFPQDRNEHTAR